jgi:type I restriction enzyme M protein
MMEAIRKKIKKSSRKDKVCLDPVFTGFRDSG